METSKTTFHNDRPAQKARAGFAQRFALRPFLKRDDGAAAVEFALVALPFFALLFAILETAFLFFAGQIVETGVYNASRLIRTGQAQNAGFSETEFKNAVCDRITAIIDCQSDLILDVRTQTDFNAANMTQEIVDGEFNFTPTYDAGGRNDIVVVRAFVELPTLVPGLGNNLSNLANGNRLIATATTFRNEPF